MSSTTDKESTLFKEFHVLSQSTSNFQGTPYSGSEEDFLIYHPTKFLKNGVVRGAVVDTDVGDVADGNDEYIIEGVVEELSSMVSTVRMEKAACVIWLIQP